MDCRPQRGARSRLALIAALVVAVFASAANAQLQPHEVLVVYDSRISGSLEIAEYYAGSAKVPGGTGTEPGLRPLVHTFDLASVPTTAPCATPPCALVSTISHATFIADYRDPIRNHLQTNNLQRAVRCIVLTRGLPHRLTDTDNSGVGDNPSQALAELNAGDATYASVDSELSLLWMNLSAGEMGGAGDSLSDGMIVNPYHKLAAPFNGYRTVHQMDTKNMGNLPGFGTGLIWRTQPTSIPATLAPGDMYLICRLDGTTVAQVKASLDRAQDVWLDLGAHAFIFDEGGGDGTQNVSDSDSEFDNDGPFPLNAGDDYEQSRDELLADGRVIPSIIRYDHLPGPSSFIVGPLINFGGGIVVSDPVAHLASLGRNHNGGWPGNSGFQYAESFNYINGAVFNSIESFNGRALNGLNAGPTGQEQVADFIASGGTLGIGNVYEPFSITVADNLFIVRNYWLGGLTWGEAAYSSLPVLSWQQIAVGDPLARVSRLQEDLNGDGVVDVEDLYAWHEMNAGDRPDLNRDGVVNDADYRLLETSVRGFELNLMNGTGSGRKHQ
ncbi:MAG: hypothetical protein KF768_09250 [Phycisphaeraceae bacterium]|nr:hypothetical protein [Phycisphaeraceae bacterium]